MIALVCIHLNYLYFIVKVVNIIGILPHSKVGKVALWVVFVEGTQAVLVACTQADSQVVVVEVAYIHQAVEDNQAAVGTREVCSRSAGGMTLEADRQALGAGLKGMMLEEEADNLVLVVLAVDIVVAEYMVLLVLPLIQVAVDGTVVVELEFVGLQGLREKVLKCFHGLYLYRV